MYDSAYTVRWHYTAPQRLLATSRYVQATPMSSYLQAAKLAVLVCLRKFAMH
jgi:hypothetical protein